MKNKRNLKTLLFFLIPLMSANWVGGAESNQRTPSDLTELGLEDLMKIEIATVYSASKYEQKVTEAPSSVSIITSDEIKKHGYRTFADILRSVRGFYVTYDRNYSYVGVRGFGRPGDYNTRILLLIDGHRLNDNVYDQAPIGTEFVLDVDLIDRIELIRGPSSSIYGSNAFFAVINVITKKGKNMKGIEASGDIGSFETYKGRLSYGNQFQNGLEMMLSGSFYDSQGKHHLYYKEFDAPATNFGITEKCDDDRFYSLFSTLSFYHFTLQGAFVSREKGIPTASFGTVFNDSHTRTTDNRGYLDLKYENRFSEGLDVMARLFYGRNEYKGDYLYDYPPMTLNKDFGFGDWWGGELKVTKKLFKKHKLVVGAEYQYNLHQDQKNYDEAPFSLYLDDKRRSNNWALYIQDEFTLFKNLILNVGVRHDQYETFGGTTNPRFALIYNPFEKTTLKLLYGKAFRAPNFYELYYNDGGISNKSNPDLKPEKIDTYELVWEQYLGQHLRGSTSIFYYLVKDLISQQVDPADGFIVFNNVEKIEAKGFELELDGKWASGLEGRISYSFQETKDRATGNILTNSPKHLAKLNLTLPLIKDKVFLGIEEQFTSARKTLARNEADSFFATNLTLFSQNLLKGLEVSASVYNLFNKKYSDPGSAEHVQDLIRQDGINLRFKLTYKF